MNRCHQRGTTLVVGLMLLAVVTLLGLAGAGSARVELQLARNEQFRENATSAASAGIEYAIRQIVITPEPAAVPARVNAQLPGTTDRFEADVRFVGYEPGLPRAAGAALAGAHFAIISTGYSAGRATDRQRAGVMLVVPAPEITPAPECAPAAAGVHCYELGELVRLSWQREALP
jgi:hypothetical protein